MINLMKPIPSRVSRRPAGFYAPLQKLVLAPAKKLSGLLHSEGDELLRYASDLNLRHERPGLSPSSEWYKTKDYVASDKPAAVTASSKGSAPSGGKGGGGGGGRVAAIFTSVFAALAMSPAPAPHRSNETLGGFPQDRPYTFG